MAAEKGTKEDDGLTISDLQKSERILPLDLKELQDAKPRRFVTIK